MKNLSPIYDLIRADGSIVVNKNLIFALGINEAIIYTELISKYNYFNTRERLTEDGYFFNTVDNLLLDTSFDKRSQKKAIDKLIGYKLIEYKVKGMPPKRYFKVVDNSKLLLDFIEIGREIREDLEKKVLQTADISKNKLNALIDKCNKPQLISALCPVNNTKPNNTKPNNTKERYIALSSNDHTYTQIYCLYYKNIYGKAHMKVSESNYIDIEAWMNNLVDSDVDREEYTEEVQEHFDTLPEGNDGSILTFMSASYRHFEVRCPKEERKYANG